MLGGTLGLFWFCVYSRYCYLVNLDGYFCGLDISSLTRTSGWVIFWHVLERVCVFPDPDVHHEGAGFI